MDINNSDYEEIMNLVRELTSNSEFKTIINPDQLKPYLSACIHITPPEEPAHMIQWITVHTVSSKPSSSRKLGNITLNWKKLTDLIPDITLAGAAVVTSPVWIAPLVLLYIWSKLYRATVEDISNQEASTILALWKNRNSSNKISEESGYNKTNELLVSSNELPLNRKDYTTIINRLSDLNCIELKDGIIWLREWVRTPY